LHSVFNLPIRPLLACEKPVIPKTVIAAEVIIIDEISMVRSDYFSGIIRCIELAEKYTGPKRIVVLGDFFQLPPVITPQDRSVLTNAWPGEDCNQLCFNMTAWDRCDFTCIELTENVRSVDKLHSDNLKRMRVGDTGCFDFYNHNTSESKLEAITLCAKKSTANEINDYYIDKLTSKAISFKAICEGEFPKYKMMAPPIVTLKEGMRVMAVCNSINGYKNGSLGTIKRISLAGIEVDFDEGFTTIVNPFTWEEKRLRVVDDTLEEYCIGKYKQIPLIPAYAITIHKSQGATFDAVNIYTDVFQEGMLYVAFSRCKSSSKIWIDKPLWKGVSLASIAVKQFYVDKGMLDEAILFNDILGDDYRELYNNE